MIVLFDRQQKVSVEGMLRQTVQSSISAVDRELARQIGALETLGISAQLDTGNMTVFRQEAQRLLGTQKDWLTVRLSDGKTRQEIVNLNVPADVPVRFAPDPDSFAIVLRTGRPYIGGIRHELGAEKVPYVLLRVPVIRDGIIKYTLSASVESDAFVRVMRLQGMPGQWSGTILDSDLKIIATTLPPAATEDGSTPDDTAPSSLLKGMETAPNRFFYATGPDGTPTYMAFGRSSLAGWTIMVGAPAEAVELPVRRSLIVTTGGGIGAMMMALSLGVVLARTIGRRQEAERRLVALQAQRTLERRLADIAANFPGAIYQLILSPEGQLSTGYMSGGADMLFDGPALTDRHAGDGHTFMDFLSDDDRARWRQVLLSAVPSPEPYRLEWHVARDGRERWVRSTARVRREENGTVVWDGVALDITDLKEAEKRLANSLAEKETLLREIHHRVKNNLQVIWSLIQLEASQTKDAQARRRLEMTSRRITVLGRIHEQLYRAENFDRIDLAAHLEELCRSIGDLHHGTDDVRIEVETQPLSCDIDTAIPIGLMANELISNSLKHGFPDGRAGVIRVAIGRVQPDGDVLLQVRDTGVGMPKDAVGSAKGTGMRILTALAKQIGAEVAFERLGGTSVTVRIAGARFTL